MKAEKGKMNGKWRPEKPKWKEMKFQKGPKWREMKAQKAKMKGNKAKIKGNESPKSQKLQNAAGLGADKICLNFIRKRAVFGYLLGGGPRVAAQTSKKWKEMKIQKAQMKGNESPKGQNKRK